MASAAALLLLAIPAKAEPQRIIAVGGAVTEVLYQVGAADRIVGVDTTSLFPPEALQTKPNVGYLRALSPEGVLALSPDLVILEQGAGPPEAVALLDQSGIPVVHVPAGHRIGDLGKKIRDVAAAAGRKEHGDRIAAGVEQDLERLKSDLSAVKAPKRVLFILSLVDGRPMAAGTDTAADGIIKLAGAQNVFGDVKGYKTISPEAAAALRPDAILMVSRSSAPDEGDNILALPAFAETPAAKTGGFIKMDALYLLGYGPRTAQSARELAARLYPQLKLAGLN